MKWWLREGVGSRWNVALRSFAYPQLRSTGACFRAACVTVAILIVGLFFIRLVLPSQLDDVSPNVFCEEDLMELADVYYVIPKFENVSIDEEWCNEILKREKKLEMHGVYHTYHEFEVFRSEEYFNEGVDIFEECFGFRPMKFKPGQLVLGKENNWIRDEMEVDLIWNQIFHKVYHCGDTGFFPNWLIRIF